MPRGTPVETYDYRDEDGTWRYEIRRFADPKDFRMGPTGYSGPRYPYRLAELLRVRDLGGTAIVPEGEKDADRLARALGDAGWSEYCATTNAGGTGWPWPNEWADWFKGLERVYVIADNDDVGRKAALERAKLIARTVPVVTMLAALPGVDDGGDISDWFDLGGTVDALDVLCDTAPRIGATFEVEDEHTELSVVASIAFEDLKVEPVEWLWPSWLPRGKLVVFDGDPALGKSTLALEIAATITNGYAFPDRALQTAGPRPILILTAEDGLQDTVLPRFLEANGNPRLAHALTIAHTLPGEDDRPITFPFDLPAIAKRIRETHAVLVVVDVLVAYLSADVNSHNDANMRAVLMRLAAVAERTGATILALRHLNKSPGLSAIYRGGGSIGIIGAARAGWLVGKDPQNPEKSVLAVTKSNLAAMPRALSYSIVAGEQFDVARVAWHGEANYDADALVERATHQTDERETQLQAACEFLAEMLIDKPQEGNWIKLRAEDAGISLRTLQRAKRELNIRDRIAFEDGRRFSQWYAE